ncbi:MAG: sugar ABC transporter permease [Nitrosomonadales bacterium]|jgi:sn-glycerol 3-phosphate transport system permease protein|nr:sugar ABC transporter permease [Bacteroidota bacterium]MBT3826465.1 sugar ABC transporter permease [Nitrosomonadales bacterium]MBT4570786.1 sugar ABC transporter permease [Nitrosomonadales bacterium]MBT4759024.1 sugar ABC transporter permease [Nitrosomonadales bacterium]MBT5150498.1 sugar ABC transporter permease [Nitrosomonadales bacterium]
MFKNNLHHIYAWLLLSPALILMGTFTHIPSILTLISSFFSTGTKKFPSKFVGIENYEMIFDDPIFLEAVINNIWYAIATIVPSIILAILMALIVDSKLSGRVLVRMAYFTPTILPMIAVSNIWLFFYTPEIGLMDQIATNLGFNSQNWLGDKDTVLNCIILITIWKEAGFFMIFYLAALQNIPPELKEAAFLEGSSKFYFFRRITFPLLMPITLFVLINATLNSFKLVDHLFILTKGGPDNASNLILYYIYETAFSFLDSSYAATLTIFLLFALAIISIVQFMFFDKRTHYR